MKGIGIIFALLVIVSCTKEKTLELPKDGTVVFTYSNECCVNGEKCEYSHYDTFYRDVIIKTQDPITGPFACSGFDYDDSYHFVGVNYAELSFYLTPYRFTLSDGKPFKLYFCIVGDGSGPFIEGKEYSNPDNVIVGFTFTYDTWRIDSDRDLGYKVPKDFYGLEVSILSSSIRFGYNYIDEKYVGEVLDFYYEFEEVITRLPDDGKEWLPLYSVGDTIKVTNGHFVQSLYFPTEYKEIIHQFIVPR